MLEDYLKGLGYTDAAIYKILNDRKLSLINEEKMIENIKNINGYFLQFGFSMFDIISMVEYFPLFYDKTLDTLKYKFDYLINIGYTKEQIISMIKRNPQLTCLDIRHIDNRIQELVNLGIDKKRILSITSRCSELLDYTIETLIDKKEFLLKLGYSLEEIKKMFKIFPQFLKYSKETILEGIDNLKKIGFSHDEVIRITVNRPFVFVNKANSVREFIDIIVLLELNVEDIRKIILKEPNVLNYHFNDIDDKLTYLLVLGFNYEDIIKIIKVYPTIFTYDINSINSKINLLESFGFKKEKILISLVNYPAFIGFSLNNIERKLNYLRSINLLDIFVLEPKQLIQSVELIYARYEFFKSKNIEITMNNYRKLFDGEIYFVSKYNITKEDLMKRYPFNENKNIIEKNVIKDKEMVNYLKDFGYPNEFVDRFSKFDRRFINKIDFLLGLGFSKALIIKITMCIPKIFYLSESIIESRINFLINIGFKKDDVFVLIGKFPNILLITLENIKSKFEILIKFNNLNDTLRIIFIYPQITGLSKDKLYETISLLESYNFSRDEIGYIILNFPSIFSFSVQTLDEKLSYLDSIGLLGVVLIKPNQLIQSVSLTYARYEYLKSIGILVTMNNWKLLFMGEKDFVRHFKITSDELYSKYSYNKPKNK